MPTYVSPFTGDVVQQTDVTYYALEFSENTQLYWPLVLNGSQVPASRIMDCTPTAADLIIYLPNAAQGANGIDILFRNFGEETFYVELYGGGGSVAIDPGISLYFYLSDNSTEAGVWQNVTFGAGTSSADAASLAGPGLAAISGKLSTSQTVNTSSSVPTINNASRTQTYVWTGGNGTWNLPDPTTLNAGWYIGFRNNGSGAVSIVPYAGSLINDTTNVTINPQDSGFIFFQSSTGEFYTLGLQTPANVTFSSAVYDVDSIIGPSLSLVSYAPIIQTYVNLSGTRTTDLTVTLPATTQLYILINDTTTTSYNIQFAISGSGASPTVLAPGNIITALSDGNQLIILAQNSSTYFYAADGSALLPSFSFLSDTSTGMYLTGVGLLNFAANGANMMLIDNSVPANPKIETPANFTATGGIDGGTF
jgi:hypothetical protein